MKIREEARKAAVDIGISESLKGSIGLIGSGSSRPGWKTRDVMEAIKTAARKSIPLAELVDRIRDLVKDVYGDQYDAAPINTCEAALWVAFDTLAAPPATGRGENYRARYIAPYERHIHHQAGYGRPFPAKYKSVMADRGVTAGELGVEGKRQCNLDVVLVPLVGAKYEAHGINYHIAPLLTKVNPEASVEKIARVAERHATLLTAFTSLGYDTPGYGYGIKDDEGIPKLQKLIGNLAKEYDVPYITDNAHTVPFVGLDLRKTGVDLAMYSLDKAVHAPTSGLMIGKEDVMIPIRKALGMHGARWGTISSYGKAAYVTNDPGKEALVGQIAVLEKLKDNPEKITKPVDELYSIVKEEFATIRLSKFKDDIMISKSYNSACVEVNYEQTWKDGELGIPIFTIEDDYSGSNPLQYAMSEMGVIPTYPYDANIIIGPGMGTIDEDGQLIGENMRHAVRACVRLLEIVCKYAGVIEESELRA